MGLVIINIIENHFVSQSLHCELECQVGTYVSRTDDADFLVLIAISSILLFLLHE